MTADRKNIINLMQNNVWRLFAQLKERINKRLGSTVMFLINAADLVNIEQTKAKYHCIIQQHIIIFLD